MGAAGSLSDRADSMPWVLAMMRTFTLGLVEHSGRFNAAQRCIDPCSMTIAQSRRMISALVSAGTPEGTRCAPVPSMA